MYSIEAGPYNVETATNLETAVMLAKAGAEGQKGQVDIRRDGRLIGVATWKDGKAEVLLT